MFRLSCGELSNTRIRWLHQRVPAPLTQCWASAMKGRDRKVLPAPKPTPGQAGSAPIVEQLFASHRRYRDSRVAV